MDVSDAVGHFGRYQYKLLAIICWRAICGAFSSIVYQLTTFTVPFQCSDENDDVNWLDSNSQCWSNSTTGSLEYCSSWSFNHTSHESIVEEWDLVCDRAWLISFGYTVKAVGNFLLYIPTGQLADKYGRKPLSILGGILGTLFLFLSVFSNGPIIFLVFRFLIGLAYAIGQNPLLCIYLESVGPKYRDSVVISFCGAWGLGIISVATVAYFLPQWRHISLLAVFAFQIPFIILIWKFVDESTRWLLTIGKYEQAKQQIIRHAKENNKELLDPDALLEVLKKRIEKDKSVRKATFLDLWKNRYLRKRSIILCAVFILVIFVYHGFLITVGRLYGNLHLNVALTGVVEIVITPIYWVVIKFFNRRRGLLACFVISGLTFLLTLAVPLDMGWLKMTLTMTGRICSALSYILLYVYVAELFPTNLRTVAMSLTMSAGRIGGMIAPVTDVLGHLYGESFLTAMYGTLSLVTSVVFFLLPETQNKTLPDTVQQSEKLTAQECAPKDDDLNEISDRNGVMLKERTEVGHEL